MALDRTRERDTVLQWRSPSCWRIPRSSKRSSFGPRSGSSRCTEDSNPAPPRWRATWIVGTVLFMGAFVQGARGQMRSYPFACYPTFEWIVGTEMPDLLIEVVTTDGTRTVVPHARDADGYRTQRQWGEVWSLVGVTTPLDEARLRAYAVRALRRDPRVFFGALLRRELLALLAVLGLPGEPRVLFRLALRGLFVADALLLQVHQLPKVEEDRGLLLLRHRVLPLSHFLGAASGEPHIHWVRSSGSALRRR